MPREDYVVPNGTWSGSGVPDPSTFRKLVERASRNLNGLGGGSYAPDGRIIFGGAGVQLSAGGIGGGLMTSKGANPGNGSLVLGDSDWPTNSPPQVRTVTFPLKDYACREDVANLSGKYHDALFPGWTIILLTGGSTLLIPLPSFRFHPGSTISAVRLNMRVGIMPVAVPASLPKFNLIARSYDATDGYVVASVANRIASHVYPTGSTVAPSPLHANLFRNLGSSGTSGAGASDPAGFATAAPGDTVADNTVTWTCVAENNVSLETALYASNSYANTTAYYAGGAPQAITITTPNVWNVVDTDSYGYFLQIVDASNTFNSYQSLEVDFTNVIDERPGV